MEEKRYSEYPNYIFYSNGNIKSIKYNRLLQPYLNNNGYLKIKLVNKDGIRKNLLVHRVIAEAFLPNPDNLPEINHKDENKLNNAIDNLEWCTRDYNINYGTRNERSSQTKKSKALA